MSFAFLPLFTGDYLRDTQHLSCSEHGIYLRLLMHCWDQKGPAPLDERKLCGIVNARSSDEIEAMRRVLGEFFTRMGDGHYNHRMQHEIERAENISGARSIAGKLGYQAKAKQLLSKSQAKAKQVPLHPPPHSHPHPPQELGEPSITPDVVVGTRGTRLPKNWTLPDEWAQWSKAERPDIDAKATSEAFADYWHAKAGKDGAKVDWLATWRHWVRNQRPQSGSRPALSAEPEWRRQQRERNEAFLGPASERAAAARRAIIETDPPNDAPRILG